jgi:carboxypeptidase Q
MRTVWRVLCCLSVALVLWTSVTAEEGRIVGKTAAEIDQQIISEVKERNEVLKNLSHLSDVIGPRMTGSANLKKANDWAAEKFKSYGLENVKLEPYTIPATWERGFARMKMTEPHTRWLTVASRAWTPGTQGKLSGELVFIPQGITQEALNKHKGKLKNAIVMRSAPSDVRAISDIGKPRDPSNMPRRRPPAGGDGGEIARSVDQFLRAEGVACTLTDSAKPHGLLNMTGSWGGRNRPDAGEPLPSVFMTHDDYALLHRLVTRKDATPVKIEVEIEAKINPETATVYNTVGEIKGSEKPDEFVVIGAHLDSWDLASGTTDNGTGTSVVLESARVLGKLAKEGIRPKRTIRFVLFTGEEQGLHGSRAYVETHKDELPRISMALVHDTGTGKVIRLPLQGREAIQDFMTNALPQLKELKVEVTSGSQGGTDHLPFEGKGVPGFAFHQDPAEYYLTHHSQSDTLDKAREPDLIQGSQVMSTIAMRIANLDNLLSRVKKKDEEKKEESKKEETKK